MQIIVFEGGDWAWFGPGHLDWGKRLWIHKLIRYRWPFDFEGLKSSSLESRGTDHGRNRRAA